MSERHDKKRATMAARLEAETSRSVEAWVDLVDAVPLTNHSDVVAWLKAEHGLGHFYARLVADAHRERHASGAG